MTPGFWAFETRWIVCIILWAGGLEGAAGEGGR